MNYKFTLATVIGVLSILAGIIILTGNPGICLIAFGGATLFITIAAAIEGSCKR